MRQGFTSKPTGPSLQQQLVRTAPSARNAPDVAPVSSIKQYRTRQVVGSGHADSLIGSILSEEEIRSLGSNCDLTNFAGDMKCLEDLHMGAFEPDGPNSICETCRCKYGVCPGHFGMITLKQENWFMHPFFVQDGTVEAILNLFCYECFTIEFAKQPLGSVSIPTATMLFDHTLVKSLEIKYKMTRNLTRLKNLAKHAIPMKCHLGHASTFFKKTLDNTIVQVLSKKSKDEKEVSQDFDVRAGFYHLKSISNYLAMNDLFSFIGFNPIKFENLVVKVIPVLPNRDRSSVPINGNKQISPFTQLYQDMLKNIRILNAAESTSHGNLESHRKTVRDLYLAYITGNGVSASKSKSAAGSAMRTLTATMDKKAGLWHKHAMGSRVNNSGRAPIFGDNGIKPNQVSIPYFMADKWRIVLTVTADNVEICKDLLKKGVIKTVSEKGRTMTVNEKNINSIDLKPGMVCKRKLLTGDVVVINRQPTLHKWSMLAMSAVVREPVTDASSENILAIGMNTIYVSGFNADFDGDEVHVHVPAGIEDRAEAMAFMSVERTPVSGQSSQNIFGLIQNSVWGIYVMSKNVKNMSREEWMRHAMAVSDPPEKNDSDQDFNLSARIQEITAMVPRIYANPKYAHLVKGLGIWNTNTLLSLAFPRDFTYVRKMGDGEQDIIIENGILVCGALKKSISGAGPGSIIQTLFTEQGPYRIVIYGYVMQQVVNDWMESQGFTISITDFMPSELQDAEIESMKDQKLRSIKSMGQRNIDGLIDPDALLNLLSNWITIPNEYAYLMTAQVMGQLRNDIVFNVIDVLQIEINVFTRGRSQVLFRDEKIAKSIENTINMVIDSAYLSLKSSTQAGGLLKSILAKNQTKSVIDLPKLKQSIYDMISSRTIEFIKNNISNPMHPETIKTKSALEKATLDADIMDDLDSMKSEGIKILTKSVVNTGIWNPKTKYNKNMAVRYVKGDFAQTYVAVRENVGKDPTSNPQDWTIPSSRGGMVTDMITSGARGNEGNLFQAKVALGNQTMSGARIKQGISGGRRVTPFFLENDPDPAAVGYVRNSLTRGTGPTEFLLSAMPARQTQTDTAFKTGETGYMQKQIMSVAGDFKILADGTVRNGQGQIVSFMYAGHGHDPARQIKKAGEYLFADVEQIVNQVNAELAVPEITRREYNKML